MTIKYGGIIAGMAEINAVVEVLKGQSWGQGAKVAQFEERAARIQRRKHALFVNSGSSALLLALATLPKGTRVAMPALQFPTLYSSAVWCGLEPVLVDSDDSFNLDPNLIPSDVGAVAFVHLAGNPTNITRVASICDELGIPLIEDNCEGFGGMMTITEPWAGDPNFGGHAKDPRHERFGYRPVGTYGSISCTSTHAAHQISTGEGGLVFCDDDETYWKMKRIRDWGRAYGAATIEGYYDNYVFSEIGLNLHNTDIQAALGLVQIERLAEWASLRRGNYYEIRSALKDLPITLPRVDPLASPSWYTFPLLCDQRDALRAHLEEKGIETRTILVGNLARQPLPKKWWQADGRINSFPVADDVFKRGLWFSVHPSIDGDDRAHIIASVREFFA